MSKSELNDKYVFSSDEDNKSNADKKNEANFDSLSLDKLEGKKFTILAYIAHENQARVFTKTQREKHKSLLKLFEKEAETRSHLRTDSFDVKSIYSDSNLRDSENEVKLNVMLWVAKKSEIKEMLVCWKKPKNKKEPKILELKSQIGKVKVVGVKQTPIQMLLHLKIHNVLQDIIEQDLFPEAQLGEFMQSISEKERDRKDLLARMLSFLKNELNVHDSTLGKIMRVMAQLDAGLFSPKWFNPVSESLFLKRLWDRGDYVRAQMASNEEVLREFLSRLVSMVSHLSLSQALRLFNDFLTVSKSREQYKSAKKQILKKKIDFKSREDWRTQSKTGEVKAILWALVRLRFDEDTRKHIETLIRWSVFNFTEKRGISEKKYKHIILFVHYFNGLLSDEQIAQKDTIKPISKLLVEFEESAFVGDLFELVKSRPGRKRALVQNLFEYLMSRFEESKSAHFFAEFVGQMRVSFKTEFFWLMIEIEKGQAQFDRKWEAWPSIAGNMNQIFSTLRVHESKHFWTFFNKLWKFQHLLTYINAPSNRVAYDWVRRNLEVQISQDVAKNGHAKLRKFFEKGSANFENGSLTFFFFMFAEVLLRECDNFAVYGFFLDALATFIRRSKESLEREKQNDKNSKEKNPRIERGEKSVKESENILKNMINKLSQNNKFFLALKCIDHVKFNLKMETPIEHFRIQEDQYSSKIFTKNFWNKLLGFPRKFTQLQEVIETGLTQLTRQFPVPESISEPLDTAFFKLYEHQSLGILNRHFCELKNLYREYLKRLRQDGVDMFEDDQWLADHEQEEALGRYELQLRDRVLFRVLGLANSVDNFQILVRIFGSVSSANLREFLKDHTVTGPLLELLNLPNDTYSNRYKFEELVLIRTLKLEPLFENRQLYLDSEKHSRAREQFREQNKIVDELVGKMRFSFAVMEQALFVGVCKPALIESEKKKILRHLRNNCVEEVKVIHSSKSGVLLDRLSVWTHSEIFRRFAEFFLYVNGYESALKACVNATILAQIRETLEQLKLKPKKPKNEAHKYKDTHKLAVKCSISFQFFLANLQMHFDQSESEALQSELDSLDQSLPESKFKKFLKGPLVLSKLLFALVFKDVRFDGKSSSVAELAIWERSGKKGFLEKFVRVYRDCLQMELTVATLVDMTRFLKHSKLLKILKELQKLSEQLQAKMASGSGGFAEDLERILTRLPADTGGGRRLDPVFLEFILEFKSILEKGPFYKFLETVLDKDQSEFEARVEKLVGLVITLDDQDEDLQLLGDLKEIVTFLFMLKQKSNFKDFMTRGLFYEREDDFSDAETERRIAKNPRDLLSKLRRVRKHLKQVQRLLDSAGASKKREEMRQKTESVIDQVESIVSGYSVGFRVDGLRSRVGFRVANERLKDEISLDKLTEIKNKVRIFLEMNLIDDEARIAQFKLFQNQVEIIFLYRDTLRKILVSGMMPKSAFLKPTRFADLFLPRVQNWQLNVKQTIAEMRPIDQIGSLSEKKEILEAQLDSFQTMKRGFLEKEEFANEDYFASFFFDRKFIALDRANLVHCLRKLNPDLDARQYHAEAAPLTRGLAAVDKLNRFDQLRKFFRERDAHFEKYLFGINQEDRQQELDASNLNYVEFGVAAVADEWTALKFFCLNYLGGDVPAVAKIFFCDATTSLADLEPFVFRSTSTKLGLPHLVVGFSLLDPEVKKETLDLYRLRFEKQRKEAYVVLFLDRADESNRSFIRYYRTCLKQKGLENTAPQSLREFGKTFDFSKVFTSDKSGNGKTFQIHQRIGEAPFECFQLSPSVDDEDLYARFARLLGSDLPAPSHVVLKVDELDEHNEHSLFRLNRLLFTLSHFKMFEFGNVIYTFPSNCQFYFEISSLLHKSLYDELPALSGLKRYQCYFRLDGIDPAHPQLQTFATLLDQLIFPMRKKQISSFAYLLLDGKTIENTSAVPIEPKPIDAQRVHYIIKRNIVDKLKKLNKQLENRNKGLSTYELTFRKLFNYLKFVNFNLVSMNTNPACLLHPIQPRRVSILQYMLELSFEITFPSQIASSSQKRAQILMNGEVAEEETVAEAESVSNNDFLDFQNQSKSFLFSQSDGFCMIYDNLRPENELDRTILEMLKPFKSGNDACYIDLDYAKYYNLKNKGSTNFYEIRNHFDGRYKLDGVVDFKFMEAHSPDFLIEKLCNCLDIADVERVKRDTRSFNDNKGYIVNLDNLFKIALIHQRIQTGLPVLLMGETGCGKTYLLQYYAEVLNRGSVDFTTVVLHAGITEEKLRDFIVDRVALAKRNLAAGKKVWIFFDEINTSRFEKILSDLIIERKFYFGNERGKRVTADFDIPENLRFMAACNPFNVLSSKKQHDDELECQFEEKEQRNRRLSHRVNPLKPSLLDIVWDFEALNKEKEKKYIALMIKAEGDYKDSLIECVFICHCFIKYEIEKNKSSVSLRDIERVNKIFHFAVVLLGHVTSESDSDFDRKMQKYQKKYPRIEIPERHFLEALFITIAVNYYFRLYKKTHRDSLLNKIFTKLEESLGKKIDPKAFGDCLKRVQELIIQRLMLTGTPIDNLSLNTPLRENLLTLFICTYSRTPLFICGRPGSSKTLSVNWFLSSFSQAVEPENNPLRGFKLLK